MVCDVHKHKPLVLHTLSHTDTATYSRASYTVNSPDVRLTLVHTCADTHTHTHKCTRHNVDDETSLRLLDFFGTLFFLRLEEKYGNK